MTESKGGFEVFGKLVNDLDREAQGYGATCDPAYSKREVERRKLRTGIAKAALKAHNEGLERELEHQRSVIESQSKTLGQNYTQYAEETAKLQSELAEAQHSMARHFTEEHLGGDGPEIDRYKARNKWLEAELKEARAAIRKVPEQYPHCHFCGSNGYDDLRMQMNHRPDCVWTRYTGEGSVLQSLNLVSEGGNDHGNENKGSDQESSGKESREVKDREP